MMQQCRCESCKQVLGCAVEGFDGKNVWITLEFNRHHNMCDECKHMSSVKYSVYFCSLQCFKNYVATPQLDKFYEDEVMWGRYERAKVTGEPV